MQNALSSRALNAIFAACALLALPQLAWAQAGEDEVFVTVGADYSGAPDFRADNRGVGASVGTFWGAHRWVSVGAQASAAHHVPLAGDDGRAPRTVLGAFAGASLALDVLQVVPFISVMPGVLWQDAEPRFGVRAALGFDYRGWRRWAVGADVAWHALADDGFTLPGYATFRFRASYVFDLRAL